MDNNVVELDNKIIGFSLTGRNKVVIIKANWNITTIAMETDEISENF